jgi:hypothetical protein
MPLFIFCRRRPEIEQTHHAGHCKTCGKTVEREELVENGLCDECRWEVRVGIKAGAPEQQEKKHHSWSLKL